MARLKGSDDLGDVKGGLVRAFRSATLTALQNAFLSATSAAENPKALEALQQFHRAARRLRISENAFNKRARPSSARPSLLAHLRTREQFAAMRSFNAAKEALLGFSPDVGRSIVRLVALGAEITTPQPRPQPNRGANLQA